MPDMNTTYINPYNFVPMEGNVKRTALSAKGSLSGYIDCSLKTLTPLCIPESKPESEVNNHKTYGFFKVDGKYIIPGSQLRGVIRSIYETITNSCYTTTVSDELSMRSMAGGIPGIVERKDGKWMLYDAQKERDGKYTRTWEKQVSSHGRDPYNQIYSLNYGKTGTVREIDDSAIQKYNQLVMMYGELAEERQARNETTSAEERFKHYLIRKDGNRSYPVFYYAVDKNGKPIPKGKVKDYEDRKEGMVYFLTPAQLSRRLSGKTLNDFLGKFAPCSGQKSGLCPACQLFGVAGDGIAASSSVRFSDAVFTETSAEEASKYVTLKILSSPHISALEFYFMLKGMDSFENVFKWTYNTKDLIMRGRKFYFHIPEATTKASIYSTGDRTRMNCTMELVNPGWEFKFKVFFNDITDTQLRDLLWSLTLGDNNGDTYAHKIGHGKPLGLGSIKIKANNVFIREFSLETGYSYRKYENGDYSPNLEQPVKTALMNMLNFNFVKGCNVAYPLGTKRGEENTMQWFVLNHSSSTYRYVLRPASFAPDKMHVGRLPEEAQEKTDNSHNSSSQGGNTNSGNNRNGSGSSNNGSNTHGGHAGSGNRHGDSANGNGNGRVRRTCIVCGKQFDGEPHWKYCRDCQSKRYKS